MASERMKAHDERQAEAADLMLRKLRAETEAAEAERDIQQSKLRVQLMIEARWRSKEAQGVVS